MPGFTSAAVEEWASREEEKADSLTLGPNEFVALPGC